MRYNKEVKRKTSQPTMAFQNNPTLRRLTQIGEDYYFDELKEKLEKTAWGKFVVIESESKKYFIHEDLLEALTQANEVFPDKFFTIIQVGSLQLPANNYKQEIHHAWPLE